MSFLQGVNVLDLSAVVVGPVCTLRFAQYGATVTKVETEAGDLMRALGGASPDDRHSGTYLHLNAGKRNICLDLRNPAGRAALDPLVAQADVLVSNMRPEALARLRLDAPTLRARHPRLIHCLITGFGPGGPYRGQPAYDTVIQGVSGIAALFEAQSAIAGSAIAGSATPAYMPLLLADHITGEVAAGAVLAALAGRARTGQGTALEIPMHETMSAFVLSEHMARQTFTPPLGPPGDPRTLHPGNAPIPTSDGWISVTANTGPQVESFLRAAGRADALSDPRFATVADRMSNVQAWFTLRNGALRHHPTAHWLRVLKEADVPAMPCHTLKTLLDDPHLQAVDLFATAPHPTAGPVRTLRPTHLTDGHPQPPATPAVPIGWDTVPVLREAGLSDTEITTLLATGAAKDGRQPVHLAPTTAGAAPRSPPPPSTRTRRPRT